MVFSFDVPLFNFRFTTYEFENYVGDFFLVNPSGNIFNLKEWVRTNIWKPHNNEVYDSDWQWLFHFMADETHEVGCQIKFVHETETANYIWVYYRYYTYNGPSSDRRLYYTYRGTQDFIEPEEILFTITEGRSYDEVAYYLELYLNFFGVSDITQGFSPVRIPNEIRKINELYYSNEKFCNNDRELYFHNNWGIYSKMLEWYSDELFDDIRSFIDANVEETTSEEDDYSNPGGGKGVVDDRSDYIDFEDLPTVSALSTGFVNCYNPAKAEIQNLHNFLMSDSFLNSVKKLMVNPIDYVISLHMIPVSPTTGIAETITVGGISTGVSMHTVISQWLDFDCGTLNIEEYWGGFIDYSPFTKVSIYLPFIGVRDLNMDDVMASTIHLKYRIDVMTGACVASLKCTSSRKVNAVLYNWNGNVAMNVPISATDYQNKVNAVLQSAISGVGLGVSASTGIGVEQTSVAFASSIMNVATSKEGYHRSGSLSANNGMLTNFTPFLIISRPNQSLPSTYKQLNGYESNIGGKVGDFSGYAEFREVLTDGLECLEEEKEMIISLLQSGVIV